MGRCEVMARWGVSVLRMLIARNLMQINVLSDEPIQLRLTSLYCRWSGVDRSVWGERGVGQTVVRGPASGRTAPPVEATPLFPTKAFLGAGFGLRPGAPPGAGRVWDGFRLPRPLPVLCIVFLSYLSTGTIAG